MQDVLLHLSAEEAQALYRLIHRTPEGQEVFCETYRQLQAHFFDLLTVEQLTSLLEGPR